MNKREARRCFALAATRKGVMVAEVCLVPYVGVWMKLSTVQDTATVACYI
jgi:hypothetical protein